MNKRIIFMILVLLLCSVNGFSDTPHCLLSTKLGIDDAQTIYSSGHWFWIGMGTSVFQVAAIYYSFRSMAMYDVLNVMSVVVIVGLYAPAILMPQRESIEAPDGGAVILDCYRDGFKRRASARNAGALFAGEIAGIGIIAVAAIYAFGRAMTM